MSNGSRSDLVNELNAQVTLLVHACHSFDQGLNPIGKHIALSLRVLLHHHGQSRALLEQLDVRSKKFLDTAGKLNPKNLLTDCNLCAMRLGGESSQYYPTCVVGGSPIPVRWLPFAEWWSQAVIKDSQGRFFSRRDLVSNVADTDGGGHVDPDLDEAYMDLSRKNSLAWVVVRGDLESPFPEPTMPCLRQIAHEVLETLRVKAGDLVQFDYEQSGVA